MRRSTQVGQRGRTVNPLASLSVVQIHSPPPKFYIFILCGCGSVVEHRLAKARVASSNLVIRSIFLFASLAQLDRASDYGSEGQGFESSMTRQTFYIEGLFYFKFIFIYFLSFVVIGNILLNNILKLFFKYYYI